MTVDGILELAAQVSREDNPLARNELSKTLARAVLDLLSAQPPCGWPKPSCERPPLIMWDAVLGAQALSPDEARGIAAMLLRAADDAERKARER